MDPGLRRRRQPRDGAWVAELTGCSTCPAGRTGCGSSSAPNDRTPARSCGSPTSTGNRLTAFATNTTRGQLADLELRHRRRARCEDRIRDAKDTGLTQPAPARLRPEPDLARRSSLLAIELTAWMQMLALTDHRRPPVGTQTTPAATVLHRRPASPATPGRSGCTYRARTLARTSSSPAWPGCTHPPPADLTRPDPPTTHHLGPVEPGAHPGDTGATSHTQNQKGDHK